MTSVAMTRAGNRLSHRHQARLHRKPGTLGAVTHLAYEFVVRARASIINPPKTGPSMWVYARKAMFCKGPATLWLNEVGRIMIKAATSHLRCSC